MKKQLMIFDFVYTGIAAILLLTIAILQNCGINITHENVCSDNPVCPNFAQYG